MSRRRKAVVRILSAKILSNMTPSLFQKKCLGIVFRLFEAIRSGVVAFLLPDGKVLTFGAGNETAVIHIEISDYRFFSRVVTGGDIGLGESYMAGEWQCDDLPGFIRLLIVNRDVFADGNPLSALAARMVNRGRHLLNRNSIAGSRKNMHRHYDLSNRFFASFLDESMTYSCGMFNQRHDTLARAQLNKLRTIIGKAGIGKDDHVLDIGCGWGAFAIEAVRKTGCRVTGITVSKKQFEYAGKWVADLGLSDRIDIKLIDYRQMQGQFDRIVSIEMLEAVGHAYLGTFFNCCDCLLN